MGLDRQTSSAGETWRGGVNRRLVVASIVVATAMTAALDFWTSAELVGSILFTLPLALCAAQRSKRVLWSTAAAVVILTLAAEFWGFDRVSRTDPVAAWVNRWLLVASLLTLATFIHFWIEKSQRIVLDAAQIIRQQTGLVAQNAQLEVLVAAANRDIGERAEAERHLVRMEARYRGLLEAAPAAMVVVNDRGLIVLLNTQVERLFGYERAELLGQPIELLVPNRLRDEHARLRMDFLKEPRVRTVGTSSNLVALRKDGTEFPVEISLSPLESPEGVLVTAAVRDVSVRKAAEARLAETESRYRGLLETAPDAMLLVNPGGEIVLANLQAKKQFGYGRGELLGRHVKLIIPEGFVERVIADTLQSAEAAAKQVHLAFELIGRHKDGTDFPIELMLSRLDGPEGVLGAVAIRDITARKEAEALLLRTMEDLNRSNDELGQFAYVASHDLQEPLRMVASYTQLLSKRYKGKLDADADEFIGFAVDGANRMQRLIQDLLAYSRIGTKGKDLVNVSSEDALEQAIQNLRNAIEDSGALVTHDPLPVVVADQGQLVQLFQNLVGNAIKYQHQHPSPGVPLVHISSIGEGGNRGELKWLFSVQDNGLGIEAKYFDRIFGMFQRLHKREEFAGTGIGLAICKKIVERHGGHISVESQLGHGSTFHFALTAATAATAATAPGRNS